MVFLMFSVGRFAQRDMLRYCLASGSDVNCKNRYGETPLHQACTRRHLEMCVFLLDSGAKVDAINKFGETALHKACSTDSLEMLKLFLAVGADPFIQSAHGLPRDVLNSQRETPAREQMIAALIEYESTYKAKPVNLLEEKDDERPTFVDALSDVMQRVSVVTGLTSSDLVINSSSLRRKGESMNVPKITVRAAVGVGTASTGSLPVSPHVGERKKKEQALKM